MGGPSMDDGRSLSFFVGKRDTGSECVIAESFGSRWFFFVERIRLQEESEE